MTLRKGSRGHELAGEVFVVSMLAMSGAGTILALMKDQVNNICGGVMTLYMVTTAWLTARRHAERPGLLDWGAMLFAATVGIAMYTLGARVAMGLSGANGVPLPMYFIMGSIALLAAAGDLRMLPLLIFWLIRVRFHGGLQKKRLPAAQAVSAVRV